MTKTRIKVCGITNLEDAMLAAELGASAIGFIFAEGSKRRVTPSVVRRIVSKLPPFVTRVGVFVDVGLVELHATMDEARLNVVQLHGSESPEYAQKVRYPVIKSFRPRPGFDLLALKAFDVHAFLFDTYAEDVRGGTGKTFDWNLVRGAHNHGRIILSGGISSKNAAEAIRTLHPYALDVNSSVESVPGRKDQERLKDLLETVRRAEHEEHAMSDHDQIR
jgi:phosphoribosylanthranilate isomerase